MALSSKDTAFCRRMRREGTLARYAEGAALTEQERREVAAHVASCPACSGEIADLQAVAHLLRANRSELPQASLSARGELWTVLEQRVTQTPQQRPGWLPSLLGSPAAERPPCPPSPGWERFGRLLSAPGRAPFAAAGALAALAVAVVVTTHQRSIGPASYPVAAAQLASGNRGNGMVEITYSPLPVAASPVAAAAAVGATTPHPSSAAGAAASIATVAPRSVAAPPVESAPVAVAESAASSRAAVRREVRSAETVVLAKATSEPAMNAGRDAAKTWGITENRDLPASRRDRSAMRPHPRKAAPPVILAPPGTTVVAAGSPQPQPTPYSVAVNPGVMTFASPALSAVDGGALGAPSKPERAPGGVGGAVGDVAYGVVTSEASSRVSVAAAPPPMRSHIAILSVSATETAATTEAVTDTPDAQAVADVATELRRERRLFTYDTR